VKKLTLGQIIIGIKKRDNKVLAQIYKDVFPVVRYYVQNHGGSQEDAKDVFQESIIVAYKQISDNKLSIKSGFEAYLYGIARLVWLKLLRNKEIHERNISEIKEASPTYDYAEHIIEDDLEMRLFRKYFRKLGPECQKVLLMIADKIPYEKIAIELGYKSEKIVRNKKYKCKEYLIKMIKSDPEYQRIKRKPSD
jgi:RNA polymerase sigma factor (sigma-70 family)